MVRFKETLTGEEHWLVKQVDELSLILFNSAGWSYKTLKGNKLWDGDIKNIYGNNRAQVDC